MVKNVLGRFGGDLGAANGRSRERPSAAARCDRESVSQITVLSLNHCRMLRAGWLVDLATGDQHERD
jgi:hypothetical protein